MFKRWIKTLGKSPFILFLISYLAAFYMRLAFYTIRWEIRGDKAIYDFVSQGTSIIFLFWHGRMLMFPPYWHPQSHQTRVLVSQHRDGGILDAILSRFNLKTIRGSSSKGGSQAIRHILKLIQQGNHIAITPDGPRGPRMHFQSHAVKIASHSGAPLIPVTYSSAPCKFFQTWDRFLLPLPFTRGVILFGSPYSVNETNEERSKMILETSLNELTKQADEMVGNMPITPAEETACL